MQLFLLILFKNIDMVNQRLWYFVWHVSFLVKITNKSMNKMLLTPTFYMVKFIDKRMFQVHTNKPGNLIVKDFIFTVYTNKYHLQCYNMLTFTFL